MIKEDFSSAGAVIFLVVLGAVLVLMPGAAVSTLVRCFGLVLILIGALKLIPQVTGDVRKALGSPELGCAATALIAGAGLMFCPEFVVSVFPAFAGLMIAAIGVAYLLKALESHRAGEPNADTKIILSVIPVICGAVICFNPFSAVATLVRIVGVILIYNGIAGFWMEAKEMPK